MRAVELIGVKGVTDRGVWLANVFSVHISSVCELVCVFSECAVHFIPSCYRAVGFCDTELSFQSLRVCVCVFFSPPERQL